MTRSLSLNHASTTTTTDAEEKQAAIAYHIAELERLGVVVTLTRKIESWRPELIARVPDMPTYMNAKHGYVSRTVLPSYIEESQATLNERLIVNGYMRDVRGVYELTDKGKQIGEQQGRRILLNLMKTVDLLNLTLKA